ncbi:MAG: AraC family transcriptional regulator [Hyphomicrobiales bacterium]|nr:MAG: AraC family transcriptional regulator [Hyphomicrobiales bacterium]
MAAGDKNAATQTGGIEPVRHFVFILIPDFTLMAFSSAVEPLRMANRVLKKEAYSWSVVTLDGQPVKASNGLSVVPDGSLADLKTGRLGFHRPDMVLVCSGVTVERLSSADLFGYLRRLHGQGVPIGGMCTSAWLLARAGLLEDRRCAIHWETLPSFAETFPDVEVQADLFEVEDNIYTCAGGTAAIDMMLHLVGEQLGPAVAERVSEQCIIDRVRKPQDRQRLPLNARVGVHNSKLLAMIELMESHLAEPLTLAQIADKTGLSRRHVERLFRQLLGRSPARYYLDLRLDRARHLLLQSDMSIVEVAIACGFVSASHFSKCYRELYGRSPQADRRQAGGSTAPDLIS